MEENNEKIGLLEEIVERSIQNKVEIEELKIMADEVKELKIEQAQNKELLEELLKQVKLLKDDEIQ